MAATRHPYARNWQATVLIGMLVVALCCGMVCSGCSKTNSSTVADDETIDYADYELHIDRTVSAAENEHIVDFDCLLEYEDLPTGCEIVSATMLLNHCGYDCDDMELYALIDKSDSFTTNRHGKLSGADPDYVFIGDPTGEDGYTCNIKPLQKAIEAYLAEIGDSSYSARDVSGTSFSNLYSFIDEDTPVEVLIAGNDGPPMPYPKWASDVEPGKMIFGYSWVHAVVLIGYHEDQVVVADPAAGIYEMDAAELQDEYEARGSYAMIMAEG